MLLIHRPSRQPERFVRYGGRLARLTARLRARLWRTSRLRDVVATAIIPHTPQLELGHVVTGEGISTPTDGIRDLLSRFCLVLLELEDVVVRGEAAPSESRFLAGPIHI